MDFLHRADIVTGNTQIVETTIDALRSATFLDGREKFWTTARVEEQTFADHTDGPAPDFLFHFGFCGSTFLAKALDRTGACLALKEPQCLTDIASQQAVLVQQGVQARLAEGLSFALVEMSTTSSEETILIKPSNWVNGLLPLLARRPDAGRAVFLSMKLRSYLRATFRGGRDRLAFCSRLASLIAHEISDGPDRLEEAIAMSTDPLDQAANIVAFLHAAQTALFDDAIAQGQWRNVIQFDYSEIVEDPQAVITRAAETLNLPAESAEGDQLANRHAKDERRSFSHDARSEQDNEVERFHAKRFDAVEKWAATLELSVVSPPANA